MSGEPPPQKHWDMPTRTAEDAVRRLTAGSLLAGRYRILDLVGVGGMGMVYRATDEQLGLDVAIKVLRPDLASGGQWLERFKQELVLARQVSHPSVVRIHDIGNDGELVFLTMDFVPGHSLRELLADERRLTPEKAVEIARQLALGLGAAHRAGVVHRDLKPGNVLVDDGSGRAEGGKDGGGAVRVAISDFGVARSLAGSGLTVPGVVVGTLGYLSPEQARGGVVDGRSDLYALGLLLYEMLTGELPFSAATEAEMLAQRLTGASRNLHWPEGTAVPPRLRDLVQRLLARDPAQRPQTGADVAQDLDGSLAPPPGKGRRIAVAVAFGLALLAVGWTVRERVWLARHGAAPAGVPGAPGPAVAAAPRHAVALLPLADDTGRPDLAWVATGMPEMLAASLAESPELRVLDNRQVVETLADLKLPNGLLQEAEARQLAGLLDADRLVGGRVRAAGGRLRIDLALAATDAAGQTPVAFSAEAPESEAFRLVDQLGASLRRQLAVRADEAAVEPVASRSPVALAALAQGAASLARGDALAAVPFLERAVAADPRYTAAWVKLAQAREALGRGEPAREAARHAVETLGSGQSRAADEARAVEARLLGKPEQAQEILSRLLARFPDDVEARVELAEAFGEQGNLERALAALEATVKLAPHHPRALYLLGKYSIQAGKARVAVDEYLVRALLVQKQLGSDQGLADVQNAFGVGYRNLGELDRAVESYEQAAAIRKRIGDERGYATTLRNLATIHTVRSEYAPAEAQLTEALAILQRLGDRPGIAETYNDFGALAEQRGNYEEALARYQQSLRARRDLGDDLALAQSFGNVGFACYLLGRYDDALVYWRQGLELAKKSGDPSGIVLATQNLGQLGLARGDWDEAVKSFLTSLRSSRELGMKEATAVSLGNLGRLAQVQGRPAAALASYGDTLGVLRELGDRRGLAEFTLATAEAELELGMTTAASEHLKAAGELLSGGNNREQQAELDRLRGEQLLATGAAADRVAAAAVLRRAVAEAAESHGIVELLAARLSAAEAPAPKGEERAALAALERLRTEIDGLGNARLRLRAAEAVARAALAAGDAGKAQRAARAGLEIAAACGGYAGAYRLHRLLASALERGGPAAKNSADAAEAAAERRRADDEIARLSRDLGPEQRKSFERIAEAGSATTPGVPSVAAGAKPGNL